MLDQANERVLAALHTLKFNEDWQEVRKWLEASLQSVRKKNDKEMDERVMRQRQGACQVLERFFKTQDEARDVLQKRSSVRS